MYDHEVFCKQKMLIVRKGLGFLFLNRTVIYSSRLDRVPMGSYQPFHGFQDDTWKKEYPIFLFLFTVHIFSSLRAKRGNLLWDYSQSGLLLRQLTDRNDVLDSQLSWE